MSTAGAWVLDLSGGRRAAVAIAELVHVLPDPPERHAVPGAPAHCREAFLWEGRVVPLLDLDAWLDPENARTPARHLGIVRYRVGEDEDGSGALGALALAAPPRRTTVDDADAAPLPEAPARWADVAIACFAHDGHPVPVLDLPRLFAGSPDGS